MKIYKPKEFGQLIGRAVITLQRWDVEGKLKAHRSPTGRRYYTHEQYLEYIGQKASPDKKIIAYSRVSSTNQKRDLESQQKAIGQFCIAQGLAISEWLSDIGSGLNYNRKNFNKLMEMCERAEVSKIVIAHKDRLVRFGYEYFEKFCSQHGANIIVMNQDSLSPEEEMTKDLLSIIHCFSSRLYGLRKYKKQLQEILSEDKDKDSK